MRHFAEQPWVDFVRGISGPEISRDVRTHLEAGCPKCRTAVGVWSRVRRFATEEAAYAPPENLVRLVKLGFASQPAKQPRAWTLASLVYDSFTQPLPAGMRSAALNVNVWQVVYEAEGLTVDLRFGRGAQSKILHLVGQVLDKQKARARQDATIELSTERDQLVRATSANALGEFQVEFEAKDDLWLSIKSEDRNTVRIPLANMRSR
jgi:hypothetical protein